MTNNNNNMKVDTYNGWKNWQTWNVALWVNNDDALYKSAVEFMMQYKGKCPYVAFIKSHEMQDDRTPDNIEYLSKKLSYKELNNMMRELIG